MGTKTLTYIKRILILIFVLTLVAILITLIYKTKDDKFITDIKDFVQNDTKVLYISNKKNYKKYPIKIFDKYEVDYLSIDSTNITRIEKNKLQKIINSKYLSNIIVVFKDGKIKDAIIEYDNKENLNKFLIKNEIIPKDVGNTTNIIDNIKNILEDELTILYLPYKSTNDVEWQDNILKSISDSYKIKYKKVNVYYLSVFQKNKLNKILQISDVEDQIVVLIKGGKIVGSIRGVNIKRTYLNELYKFSFIKNIEDYINYIDYNSFKKIINSDDKNIIIIGKKDCKYCSDVIDIFNQLVLENEFQVYYIDIETFDTEISEKVQQDLKNLEYEDGFSTPLTIIVEKGKLINYIIGTANENYFKEILQKQGIIN